MGREFTPGPWVVDRNGLSGYGDNGNTFDVVTEAGRLIASLPEAFRLLDRDNVTDPAYIEEKANATLLAAAPDLFAALETIVRNYDSGNYAAIDMPAARTALSKALGEGE